MRVPVCMLQWTLPRSIKNKAVVKASYFPSSLTPCLSRMTARAVVNGRSGVSYDNTKQKLQSVGYTRCFSKGERPLRPILDSRGRWMTSLGTSGNAEMGVSSSRACNWDELRKTAKSCAADGADALDVYWTLRWRQNAEMGICLIERQERRTVSEGFQLDEMDILEWFSVWQEVLVLEVESGWEAACWNLVKTLNLGWTSASA